MKIIDDDIKLISIRFEKLAWALDERMRRLYAAAEALALGRGGITKVAQATGISRRAIHVGLKELSGKKLGSSLFQVGDCRFRPSSNTDSAKHRTLIPEKLEQSFR